MAMISVPRDAFALLFAYCHTPSGDVPAHIRAHADYPGTREGRSGHLSRALAPYVAQAFADIERPTPNPEASEDV
jgi:hypothetical protein